jgi:hypothetical protein
MHVLAIALGAFLPIYHLRQSNRLERLYCKMTILVDSDILIEVARGKEQGCKWIELSGMRCGEQGATLDKKPEILPHERSFVIN